MAEPKGKITEKRKPKCPAVDLPAAIEKTRLLYQADGTAGTLREAAIRHIGYKGAHGASITMLTSLEKYGLTHEENRRIMLTKDALLILVKGGDETKRVEAIERCALKPELYGTLWERISKTGSIPSDATLRSELVTEMGYSPKKVDGIVRDFKATLDYADLRPKPSTGRGESDDMGVKMGPIVKPSEDTVVRDYSIPRRDQKLAILRLEYPVTKDDIEHIGKWLDLMKDTIPDQGE